MNVVRVQRVERGYTEHLHPFEVVIDDDVVGQLGPGEAQTFTVAKGLHELFVRLYWCRSEKLKLLFSENEELSFHCDTRANLLTDGFWATIGRRRYLRLTQVAVSKSETVATPPEHNGINTTPGSADNIGRIPRLRWLLAKPLFFVIAAALFLPAGSELLIGASLAFLAAQAIIAIGSHFFSSKFASTPRNRPRSPFQLLPVHTAMLSGVFTLAAVANLTGIAHGGALAGCLALGAATAGAVNTFAVLPR